MKTIIITGSMGAGKTSVLGEAADLLAKRKVAYAAIDFDAVGNYSVPSGASQDVKFDNLSAMWSNYAALGIDRLLLATAVETNADLARIRDTLPPSEIVTCRLTAEIETMEARVRRRETGIYSDQFVARVRILNDILDRSAVEDFSVVTDDRSVTDIAREMLERAAWVPYRPVVEQRGVIPTGD